MNSRTYHTVKGIAVATITFGLFTYPLFASFIKLTTEQKIRNSDSVVQGTFTDQQTENGPFGTIRVYRFTATRAYKGLNGIELPTVLLIVSEANLRLPTPPLGKELVVFLREQKKNPGRYFLIDITIGLPVISSSTHGPKQIVLSEKPLAPKTSRDTSASPSTKRTSKTASSSEPFAGKAMEQKTLYTPDEFQSFVNAVLNTAPTK